MEIKELTKKIWNNFLKKPYWNSILFTLIGFCLGIFFSSYEIHITKSKSKKEIEKKIKKSSKKKRFWLF